ncbi:MAG TPA: hypothetical protein VF317_12830 [Dermatophilaceae bacterium]
MAHILAVPDRGPLPALHEARHSIDLAIQDARRGRGIRYDTFVAISTLRQLMDELEAVA